MTAVVTTHQPVAVAAPPRVIPLDTDRRGFLGASDVGAVLGLSRFRTPLQVYLQKRGELPETPSSERMEWGNRLEPVVRQAYIDRHIDPESRLEVHFGDQIGRVQHPSIDWMVCTPDGIVGEWGVDGLAWRYGLECKTASLGVAHLWGESGTDQVPDAYALQCHYSMLVTGLDRWDVAVLIGGQEFRTYTLRRDPAVIDLILPPLVEFWDRVSNGNPPEPTAGDNPLMAQIFHHTREELIESDPVIDELALQLAERRRALAECEESVANLEARIKVRIGERAGAVGPWGKIIWRQNRDSARVDWRALALSLGATPEQVESHTTIASGARPFRVTFTGGES